jgi:hypothetical protein
MPMDLVTWLRERCSDYAFDVAGVYQRAGTHEWPLVAVDATDLLTRLAAGGHILPLPREPAALANVLEVSVAEFVMKRAAAAPGLDIVRGSERGYPDLEFSGPALDGDFHAVDVKVARRAKSGRRTESRITSYTGNTYFRHPSLHWPGTLRPFENYRSHLDLIIIYTLDADTASRAQDLELMVQPSWSIASRHRSSTTREYIGAVDLIDDLRQGTGEFDDALGFYRYWRSYNFRVSRQVSRTLDKLVREQRDEIRTLRRQRDEETTSAP